MKYMERIAFLFCLIAFLLSGCGKSEEDYKIGIAKYAEEQGLENVIVSLEWVNETNTYKTIIDSSNFSEFSYTEMADSRTNMEKWAKDEYNKNFAMQFTSSGDKYNVLVGYNGIGTLVVKKNGEVVYDSSEIVQNTENENEIVAISEKPRVGMSAKEVIYNTQWGEPEKKNISEYSWGISEQWCYSDNRYVYIENGIVTSVDYQEK